MKSISLKTIRATRPPGAGDEAGGEGDPQGDAERSRQAGVVQLRLVALRGVGQSLAGGAGPFDDRRHGESELSSVANQRPSSSIRSSIVMPAPCATSPIAAASTCAHGNQEERESPRSTRAENERVPVPGGENYAQVAARVGGWIESLTADTVAISHGATTRILRGLLAGMDWRAMSALDEPQGVVFRVRGHDVAKVEL